jgi:hypothetical protein
VEPDLSSLSLTPHTPLIHRPATPNAPYIRRSQSIDISPVHPRGLYRPWTKAPRAAALPEQESTTQEPFQPPPYIESEPPKPKSPGTDRPIPLVQADRL